MSCSGSVVRCRDALGGEPASFDCAQQATLQVSLFCRCQSRILPSGGDGVSIFDAGCGKGEQVSNAVRMLALTIPQPQPPDEKRQGH